jgi:alanine racemase
MRPSWVEVDLPALAANAASFRSLASPAKLCAVVKADAYAHGDVPVAETALAAGASMLAVALVEEGVRLREGGIEAPILLLSEPAAEDVGEMVRWDLTPTVYRPGTVEALARAGCRRVHVKVDTGMHRVGADPADLAAVVEAIRGQGMELAGGWTHFAVAEDDPEFTRRQIEVFDRANLDAPLSHLANTAGAILFPEARRDMVRVGLGLYGIHPAPVTRQHLDLAPVMRVVSHVSFVRRLPAGERISYGRIRPLPAEATVATAPIGYADGVPRTLAARGGEVLVRGRRYPLAGNVTMDQLMIDLGDDPVEVGDEVVLIGRQGSGLVTAEEWADLLGTIPWEIVSRIGPRLPRRYRT